MYKQIKINSFDKEIIKRSFLKKKSIFFNFKYPSLTSLVVAMVLVKDIKKIYHLKENRWFRSKVQSQTLSFSIYKIGIGENWPKIGQKI